MTNRFSLFILLFGLAACQPAPNAEIGRTVSVSGEGEISVEPEIAVVRLTVQARNAKLGAAQNEAGKITSAVLELAESLNIAREQVQSTQVHVQPEFDWRDGRQTFRGYLVQREVRVELEDLEKLGPLVERAMQAGVNQVSEPELRVQEPRRLHREALRLAAADAQANARVLAESLGAELGKVRRIDAHEQGDGPVRPMRMQMMESAAGGQGEQTYQAGRITVRVRVSGEFELR